MAFLRYAGKARKLWEEHKKERFLDRVPEKSFGPPERARYEKMKS
jgi:hypothetical protein